MENKNEIVLIDITKLSRKERREYRKKLIEEGKSYCTGPNCKGQIKSLDEFPKAKIIGLCNKCNLESVNKSEKKNEKAWRREKNRLKIDKKCEKCGCDDIELLEFDHILTYTKEINISQCRSAKKILSEVDKTQMLCIWCHRLKSQEYTNKFVKKTKKDYAYTYKEEAEKIDFVNSKPCNGELCKGRIRNYDKFYHAKSKTYNTCKRCYLYNDWIERNRIRNIIDNIKLEISECKECQKKVTNDTLCCFDFDHIIMKGKKITISKLRGKSHVNKELFEEELKKCQLLCCHCHKKKTIKELNFRKYDKETITQYDHISINKEKAPVKDICSMCNTNEKSKRAKMCQKCYDACTDKRKVERPSFEQLETEIAEMGFVQVGKKYGVTDNAIRAWIRQYIKHEGKQITKQFNNQKNRYTIRKKE